MTQPGRLYEVGFHPVKMKGNAPQLTDLKSDAEEAPLTGVTMAEVFGNVNEKKWVDAGDWRVQMKRKTGILPLLFQEQMVENSRFWHYVG